MRLKLCFLFAVLGLAAAFPAEEVVEDEVEIDVGDLLKELFVPALRDGRELEMTEEEAEEVADLTVDESVEREAVAEVEEQDEATVAMKAMEIARFNNYMDAIYKRMNGALKAKMMDPMELNLDQKIQQKSDKKDAAEKKPRKVTKREAEEEEEAVAEAEEEEEDDLVDMVEIDHRMGKQEKAKKAKKTKKTGDAKKVKGDKKAKLEKKKEEKAAAKKEKQQQKMKKQEEREKKRAEKKKKKEQKNRGRRSGAEDEDKKKKRKRNQKNKKNNSGQDEKKSRNKSKNNNNNKKKARNNNQKNEKMLGSLSGIATLKREGDVVVMDEENHKVVESTFNVGPLKLEVSKVTGKGKERSIKSAIARTDVMMGKMILKVKPDGSAYVKKVVFKEPKNVDVKGSLNDNKQRNIRYLRTSVNRMRPLAAMRVLKTARFVLKGPSNKEN